MKNNLKDKVVNFSNAFDYFAEKVAKAEDTFEGAKEAEDKSLNMQNVEEVAKKFAVTADNLADQLTDVEAEVSDKVEDKGFARNVRIMKRHLKSIAKNFADIQTQAETINNMSPEGAAGVSVATPTTVNTPKTPTSPSGATPVEGVETQTNAGSTQTAAETTSPSNFSVANFTKFTTNKIRESFAEVKDTIEAVADVKNELKDKDMETKKEEKPTEPVATTPEPPKPAEAPKPTEEEPKAEPEKPAEEQPPKEEKPKEEPKEFTDEGVTAGDDDSAEDTNAEAAAAIAEAEDIRDFGRKAILEGNEAAVEDLNNRISDFEKKVPGGGEEIVSDLENFSENFSFIRNNNDIFCKIKDFCNKAFTSLESKTPIDADNLGAEATKLEGFQKGSGELLTSVIECFGKILNMCGGAGKGSTTEGTEKKEFDPKPFCATIDKFCDALKPEGKLEAKFCRSVKSKCFTLQDAIEDNNVPAIKETSQALATDLDTVEDNENVKSFGEQLCKFAEELAKNSKEETPSEPANTEVPAEVAEADNNLNKVIDKIDEKGEQLKPEVTAFAKKLCSAYKSMKCFTKEDLNNKLTKVEELKNMCGAGKPEPAAPKAPEKKTTLVEEEPKNPSELPSDSSIQNFTAKPNGANDDALGHLYDLDIA